MRGTAGTKKRILSSLLGLIIFCVVPALAQTEAQKEPELQTEFIKLNVLEIKRPAKSVNGIGEEGVFLMGLVKPLLSNRGSVEAEVRGRHLIVTDTQNRTKLIVEFIKLLDNSGLLIDKLMAEAPKSRKKLVVETVRVHILPAGPYCDVGEEARFAALYYKQDLLIKTLEAIKVKAEPIRLDLSGNGLTLRGDKKRVALAKTIVPLLEQAVLD